MFKSLIPLSSANFCCNPPKKIFIRIRESTTNEADADTREDEIISVASPGRAHRSASTDILGKKESPTEKKWHFDTLKAWGRSRLKLISPKSDEKAEKNSHDLPGLGDDTNVYEMITTQRRKSKSHERKPSSSSSSGKSIASSIAVSIPMPQRPVKLRECAAQKRERRKGNIGNGILMNIKSGGLRYFRSNQRGIDNVLRTLNFAEGS